MASIPDSPEPLATGSHGKYKWLASRYELDDILRLCPAVVLGKYLAITSIDSSRLSPTAEEVLAGWENRQGIAYSPLVQSVEKLPRAGWDEWYVFRQPLILRYSEGTLATL
jgi:hypothetical protein